MRHPIQPLAKDEQGVVRFKANKLVCALLDHGQRTGLGLNELAVKFGGEYVDDWRQLAQLLGYSLSGYGDLSYVDDDTYSAATRMYEQGEDERTARVGALQEELDTLREALREPMARLFGVHPDDLRNSHE